MMYPKHSSHMTQPNECKDFARISVHTLYNKNLLLFSTKSTIGLILAFVYFTVSEIMALLKKTFQANTGVMTLETSGFISGLCKLYFLADVLQFNGGTFDQSIFFPGFVFVFLLIFALHLYSLLGNSNALY